MLRNEMTFTKNQILTIQKCIDSLGMALASADHQWTLEERRLFERASSSVKKAIENATMPECYNCHKATEDVIFDGEDYLPCHRGRCADRFGKFLSLEPVAA